MANASAVHASSGIGISRGPVSDVSPFHRTYCDHLVVDWMGFEPIASPLPTERSTIRTTSPYGPGEIRTLELLRPVIALRGFEPRSPAPEAGVFRRADPRALDRMHDRDSGATELATASVEHRYCLRLPARRSRIDRIRTGMSVVYSHLCRPLHYDP